MNSLRLGTAVMIVLTVALTLSSRACGVSEVRADDDVPSVSPGGPPAIVEQRTVGRERPGATSEADLALAAVDAAVAAADTTGGDDRLVHGEVGQPQAIAAPSSAARPPASVPTARWVWALLTLGVVAAVLLTTVGRGVAPAGSDRGPTHARRTEAP